MRRTRSLMAFCFLLGAISHSATPLADHSLAAADNAFGFKLIKQLAEDHPATNISISSYSAATVLHMVASGAAGKTKTEMQQVLATTGLSFADVNVANRGIAQSLTSANTPVILTVANAIWYRPHTPINPSFISTNKQFYGATVEALNFSDPHAVEIINAWASEKTQGKIKRIADGMIDPESTRLFLADAIYFKGKWSKPFAVKDTKDRSFHLHAGGEKRIPMMLESARLQYREGPGYQAVRLPYSGDNLAMYVFLPASGSSPENVLGALSGDTWQEIKHGFRFNEGTLVLPKFKVEYSVALKGPLQSLGMKAAFGSSANFSGIAPRLLISAAQQKTFVEVNEEGTEAAAVTGMEVQATSVMPRSEPFEMIVDRPFVFLIEDKQTEVILFMGTVFDPTANRFVVAAQRRTSK
jgi:serine protease inhibitor